jgi:hypothetical protein
MKQITKQADELLNGWLEDFDISDTSWRIDLEKMEFREAEDRYAVTFFYDDEGILTPRLAHIETRLLDTCRMAGIPADNFIGDVLRVATFLFARELRKRRAAETAIPVRGAQRAAKGSLWPAAVPR